MGENNTPAKRKLIAPKVERNRKPGMRTARVGTFIANNDTTAVMLRKKAERLARKKAPVIPENLENIAPAEVRKILHELMVHQIELEMQNVELRATEEKLEESRAQYFDLYDVAPIGYFSISEKGIILEANLTGANMLGVIPSNMRGQPLSKFIQKEDQDIYYLHRKKLFDTRAPQLCEMRMSHKGGSIFWARIEATVVKDHKSGHQVCRAAMSDVTVRKEADKRANERTNELRAFYNLAELATKEGLPLDNLYLEFTNILPASWQFPEIAWARTIIDGREFRTDNFADSK